MSKTYRRKNAYEEYWWCSRHDILDDGTYVELPPTKYDLVMFHSDNGCYYRGAGKYEKQRFCREMRFKNKAILGSSVRDCNDEPMFIPYKHPYN